MAYNVTIEDDRTVLGNVEIKERALVVSVNSAARAERAVAILHPVLDGLAAAALTQIQAIDQMMAQQRDHPRPASDIPIEMQTKLVHESLDRQYRALLDQPVPIARRYDAACRCADRLWTREACRLAEAPRKPFAAAARPGQPSGDLRLRLAVAGAEG